MVLDPEPLEEGRDLLHGWRRPLGPEFAFAHRLYYYLTIRVSTRSMPACRPCSRYSIGARGRMLLWILTRDILGREANFVEAFRWRRRPPGARTGRRSRRPAGPYLQPAPRWRRCRACRSPSVKSP